MAQSVITFTMNPAVDLFADTDQMFDDSKTRCQQTALVAGGGGINVARNVRRMGTPTIAIFPAGGPHGTQLTTLLEDDGQPYETIPIQGNTRQNLALTDRSRDVMHHFVFPGPTLSDDELDACASALTSHNAEYLVLSGSLPDNIDQSFYASVTQQVKQKGTKVLLDTSGNALQKTLYQGAYLAKLNRREFASLGFDEHSSLQQLQQDMRKLVKDGAVDVLIVTLTRGGAVLISADGEASLFHAPEVHIVSHVGAGDSFMSTLVHRLVRGESLVDACRAGVAAATVTVQCAGNQLEDFDWLERTIKEIKTESL